MSLWTIIPVKRLRDSKRRLAHLLSAEERAELISQFLDNLLGVLNGVETIDHILVVTGDPQVADLATRHSAQVLAETEPYDLNSAVTQGRDYAVNQGATAVLVLPADLPFAREEDIRQVVSALDNESLPLAAICSDETGDGTNALLLAPPEEFVFQYGPASAGRHVAEAARLGMECRLIRAPGLRFDLDTESDWLVYNGY
ncbi:MAG: 2-phospho-L-lactate guanylyltransferase, partial [Chloroflexota bacterium]